MSSFRQECWNIDVPWYTRLYFHSILDRESIRYNIVGDHAFAIWFLRVLLHPFIAVHCQPINRVRNDLAIFQYEPCASSHLPDRQYPERSASSHLRD